MIVGDEKRFAIEADVVQRVDRWVFGHFRFWLCGDSVGNWDDSADLRGCVNWLRDFYERPRDRCEPRLFTLPAEDVWRRLSAFVAAHPGGTLPASAEVDESLADAFSRFYISHLGMSSFDRFDVVLIKNVDGAERCLWREGEGYEIHECYLAENEMEETAAEFCGRFKSELF